ncbi:cohesin domain-containing protein [Methanolobus sp. WCC5]|uniref:cohesin domain-containing protein n=1 Tax=Methanolobus sp. WCC5 TaxID=3125785 RepID=UPI0032482B6A
MTKVTWKGMAGSAAILLIFCACFMVGVGLAAAAPSVSVDPQTNEYDAGDTFQVSILVDSDASDLRAVNLQLDYDPAVLQVNSITNNNLLGAGALVAPASGDDGAGTITYGIAATSGPYAPVAGTMITIDFEVKAGAADGIYDLDLMNVVLLDQTSTVIAGVAVMDGTVKVGDDVIPPTDDPEVKITPAVSGPVAPGDTFQVEVEVDSADENLRAVNLQLKYDAAVLMVNGVTNENLLGAGALVAPGSGDDGAGTITYGIASTAGAYTPQAGTMLTIEFEVKAGAANGIYNLDLDNVGLMDETNTAIAGVVVTDATVQVADGPVVMPEVMVSPAASGPVDIGETFQVEVMVDSADKNLRAVSLQLGYDASVLMVNSITNENLLGAGALEAPGSGDDGAGTITYGIAATGGVYAPTAGTMLTIEFEVKAGAADGVYDLDLMNVVLQDQANAAIPGVVVTDGTVEVSTVPNVVPGPEIVSHADGDVVSKTQIVEVVDNSGQDDILTATFAVFADTNGNCIDDEVGGVWTVFATDNDGSDGWTAVLDTTSVPDGQYLIKATLDDGQDSAFHIVCVEVYNPEGIILLPGWNLISFPETLENASIDFVLQDFTDTEVDYVFYDDASVGMMVVPTTFEPLKAYWVHNNMSGEVVILEDYLTPKVPSTPPSLMLYPGWNAIGHNAKVELSAEIGLATIDDSYIKVKGPWVTSASEYAYVGYNGVEGVINGNQVGTDVFSMNVYEGYYVFVDEECILA